MEPAARIAQLACRVDTAIASRATGVSLIGEVAVMPTSDADPGNRPPQDRPAVYGVGSRAGGAPAGWYPDPEHAGQPQRQRYWDGHDWTGRRRTEPPVSVRWLAPVFFTVLGVATGITAWPANGASCHLHPPPILPSSVTLSLWLAGIVLAGVLIVVSWVRWRRVVVPMMMLLGTVVLPVAVAAIGVEDCLA
jgi:hypothetical protein